MFVRIYTGDDGETHFEDLPMPEGINWTADQQPATGITFRCVESGNFVDWHVAPRRQYVITLQGGVEIGIGDGTVKRFGPGDVLLADDLTGRGHTTKAVGDVPRVSVAIPLAE